MYVSIFTTDIYMQSESPDTCPRKHRRDRIDLRSRSAWAEMRPRVWVLQAVCDELQVTVMGGVMMLCMF